MAPWFPWRVQARPSHKDALRVASAVSACRLRPSRFFLLRSMGVKNRSSYASPCDELRAAYHDCFNRWYSDKFSKGQWDKEGCVVEWKKYRACLAQHLEDKHLRRLLVEADAATFSNKDDTAHSNDGDSGQ